jgi:hypothetical protein
MILRSRNLGTFELHPAGHVRLWRDPTGRILADNRHPGFVSANDPAFGGIGAVAWHHYRANGEPDIWRRGWEINPLQTQFVFPQPPSPVTLDRHGRARVSVVTDYVDLYGPVMRTRHSYVVGPNALKVWVTVKQTWPGDGFAASLKEPKIVVGLVGHYRTASVFAAAGTPVVYDLARLHDPAVHTQQLREQSRLRVRFDPGAVVVSAGTARGRWTPSRLGLDGWAQASNDRPRLGSGAAYCLQGPGSTLTRNWEIVKRGLAPTALLLHGWEGGTGLPDCLNCARAFGPAGESWTNVVTITRER